MGFLFRACLQPFCNPLQSCNVHSILFWILFLAASYQLNLRHIDAMNKTALGFSLIEMMVVIILMAMLSAGGLYGFQQWQQHQQLWQTTQQLSQFLYHLRNDANQFNRDHVLRLWQQQGKWCLTSQQYDGKPCAENHRWQFIPRFKAVSMVEMTQGLGFYGVMSTAKPGHIILSNGIGQQKMIVSVWGRIRTCSLADDAQCE